MSRQVVHVGFQPDRLSDGHALREELAQGGPRDTAQDPGHRALGQEPAVDRGVVEAAGACVLGEIDLASKRRGTDQPARTWRWAQA